MAKRIDSDEHYVIDLVTEILQVPCERQRRFETLLGDPGKDGQRRRLPVDAFFAGRALIVEYRERQHTEHVPIMDRLMTISGVLRAEQGRLYDGRREEWAKAHGYKLLVVSFQELAHDRRGRLLRHRENDLRILRSRISLE